MKFGRVYRVIEALLLVTVITVASLFFTRETSQLPARALDFIEAQIAYRSGFDVHVDHVGLDFFPPRLTIHGLQVGRVGNPRRFLQVERINVVPGIGRGFAGKASIDWLEVIAPRLTLTYRRGHILELIGYSPQMPNTQTTLPVDLWGALVTRADVDVDIDGQRIRIVGMSALAFPEKSDHIPVQILIPPMQWFSPQGMLQLKETLISFDVNEGNLLSPQQIVLKSLRLWSEEMIAEGDGRFAVSSQQGDSRLRLSVDLAILKRLLKDKAPPISGQVMMDIDAKLSLSAPSLSADVRLDHLALAGRPLGQIDFHLNATPHHAALPTFTARVFGGEVQGALEIGLARPWPVHVAVDWRTLQLGEIFELAGFPASWVAAQVSGQADLKGQLANINNGEALLEGETNVQMPLFAVYDRSFRAAGRRPILEIPQGAVRSHFQLFRDRIDLTQTTVSGAPGEIQCQAQLTFSQKNGFWVKGASPRMSLTAFKHIAGVTLSGEGKLRFELGGPYGPPTILGEIDMEGASVARVPLGHVTSEVSFTEGNWLAFKNGIAMFGASRVDVQGALRFLSPVSLNFSGDLSQGALSDLKPLLFALPPALQEGLTGMATAHFEMSGGASEPNLDVSGTVKRLELLGQPIEKSHFALALRLGEFDDFDFHGEWPAREAAPASALNLSLTAQPRGIAIVGGLTSTPLSQIKALSALQEWTAGDLSATYQGLLTPDGALEGQGEAAFMNVKMGDQSAPPITLQLTTTGQNVALTARGFDDLMKLQGRVSFDDRATLELEAQLDAAPWSQLGGFTTTNSVRFSSQIMLRGSYRNIASLQGQATLHDVSVSAPNLNAHAMQDVVLHLDHRNVTADPFTLLGPDIQLNASGNVDFEGRTLFKMLGKVDLAVLSALTSAVQSARGDLAFDIAVSGPLRSLAFNGSAQTQEATAQLAFLSEPIEDLSARLTLTQNLISITELSGRVGEEGEVSAQGEMRVSNNALKSMALNFDASDVTYWVGGILPARVAAKLRLNKVNEQKPFELSGDIKVIEARYTRNHSVDELLPSLKRRPTRVDTFEASKENIRFNVNISAENSIIIDDNLANAEFRGELKLVGSNLRPGLLGSLTPLRARLFFKGVEYEMNSGVISFADRMQIVPRVDMRFKAFACGSNLWVTIQGTADNYQLDASGRDLRGLLLTQEDALSCLSLGFRRGLAVGAATAQSTTDEITSRIDLIDAVTGLSEKFKQFFAVVDQMRISAGYSPRLGKTTPRLMIMKEIVRDRLRLSAYTSLIESDQMLQLEFKLPFAQDSSLNFGFNNSNLIGYDVGLNFQSRWEF